MVGRRETTAPSHPVRRGALRALAARIAAIGTARFETAPRLEGLGAAPIVQPIVQALSRTHERVESERTALRRFASDAAHQLRTPLAVLAARMEAPSAEWDAERMRGDLRWMERLVDQLLAASRSGTTVIDPEARFDLPALVREVVEALAPLAIYRGRDIEMLDERRQPNERRRDERKAERSEDAGAGSSDVFGIASLAHEALSNLIENALDHAPPGSLVSVVLRPGDRVEVRDRGAGVPEACRERIFERFSQGARPTTGGAGLGLSIVADIMQRHGGTVAYEDRSGGGAVFALRFAPADAATVPPSDGRHLAPSACRQPTGVTAASREENES